MGARPPSSPLDVSRLKQIPAAGPVMSPEILQVGGVRVLVLTPEGQAVGSEADALDLLGEALGAGAAWIALPVARAAPDVFRLETRLAGAIAQKLVNYGVGLAFVGDLSDPMARSQALRDWAHECNRGRQVWFAADLAELETRLSSL